MVLAVLLAFAAGSFIYTHYEPRRARPDGYRAGWDSLPLETESTWSMQKTRREVVLNAFYVATPKLQHCNAEYFRGADSLATQLELLIQVRGGRAEFVYVNAEPKPELSPALLTCIERALERVSPVAHPALGTDEVKWRLGLSFLFHPPVEVEADAWWERFVPDSWRSGGNSSIHVG